MEMRVVNGDILSATEKYVAHQCNCEPGTRPAAGVALRIFKRWPHADAYRKPDPEKDVPGEIRVFEARPGRRGVVCLFAQLRRGKPKEPDDGPERRILWFRECLRKLARVPDLVSVAMPYRVGCNLGGGDWERYEAEIRDFALANPGVRTVLYRMDVVNIRGIDRGALLSALWWSQVHETEEDARRYPAADAYWTGTTGFLTPEARSEALLRGRRVEKFFGKRIGADLSKDEADFAAYDETAVLPAAQVVRKLRARARGAARRERCAFRDCPALTSSSSLGIRICDAHYSRLVDVVRTSPPDRRRAYFYRKPDDPKGTYVGEMSQEGFDFFYGSLSDEETREYVGRNGSELSDWIERVGTK